MSIGLTRLMGDGGRGVHRAELDERRRGKGMVERGGEDRGLRAGEGEGEGDG